MIVIMELVIIRGWFLAWKTLGFAPSLLLLAAAPAASLPWISVVSWSEKKQDADDDQGDDQEEHGVQDDDGDDHLGW